MVDLRPICTSCWAPGRTFDPAELGGKMGRGGGGSSRLLYVVRYGSSPLQSVEAHCSKLFMVQYRLLDLYRVASTTQVCSVFIT